MAQAKREQHIKRERPALPIRIIALFVSTLLVVGAVAAVVYRSTFNLDALKRWITYRSLTLDEAGQAESFTYDGDSTNSFATLNGGLLVCSTTSLHLYSRSGIEWDGRTVSMTNPIVQAAGNYGIAYDTGGTSLYLYSGSQEAWEYDSGGNPIFSARVDEDGWLTIAAKADSYKASVTVYNASQSAVVTENLSGSFVLDAAVSPDHKHLGIVTTGQDGSSFSCSLAIYSISTGTLEKSVSLGDSVPLDMDWEPDTVWIQTENGVDMVDTDSYALSTWTDTRHLQDYSLEGNGFAVVMLSQYRAGSVGEVSVVDAAGQSVASITIQEEILSLSACGPYVAVLTASGLTIYTSELKEYASLDSASARKVIMREDGSAMLIGTRSATLYVP